MKSLVLAVAIVVIPCTIARGEITPDGNNVWEASDIIRVQGCIGMAVAGNCANSDVDGNGVIDQNDVKAALCRFGGKKFSVNAGEVQCIGVPAVSEWGLVAMLLTFSITGTIILRRHRLGMAL